MKSVALHNLGCKVNGYEIDVMQQMLQKKGYKVVPFDEEADIYIINTCTVTNMADRKSRQMLHKAKKQNQDAVVVAVGCYVQVGQEDALQDNSIDLAIGNNRKKDLIPILEEFMEQRDLQACNKTLMGKTMIDINGTSEYESMTLTQTAEHTRAFIKIQDGCNQFCSYCIIPYARGRVRSRNGNEIVSEIKGLVENGYKEVVLTGIHISSYGVDFKEPNLSLLQLIEQIHDIPRLERIRLGSLEPRIISEEFAQALAHLNKVCPHFHLSLQSGCDNTLQRMNRRYDTAEYENKVQILRKVYDKPAITTDVIVGFPGETEEEFATTYDFLEKMAFYEMHIFKYSKRLNTKAAMMENQVTDSEKGKRSNILFLLEKNMSKNYLLQFIDQTLQVLVEESKEIDGEFYQMGHTKEYVKVAFRSEQSLEGKLVSGKVIGFLKDKVLLIKI